MKPPRSSSLIALALVSALCPTPGRGHESPIDHVERELRLFAEDGKAWLVYRLLPTERATLMELKTMDADGDGTISDRERAGFFVGKAQAIAKKITLNIDGRPLPLEPGGSVRCDPQLGQTFLFSGPLPALQPGRHPGRLVDGHSRDYPGGFVWKDPGREGSEAIRFEPVTPATQAGPHDHPPWLELQFNVVVR
ncbi:MAG: hypothetical protein WD060_12115 [Pirellulales bacterium]